MPEAPRRGPSQLARGHEDVGLDVHRLLLAEDQLDPLADSDKPPARDRVWS